MTHDPTGGAAHRDVQEPLHHPAQGPVEPPPDARRAVGASAVALGTRQAVQVAFGVVLARVLGPDTYAAVAAATVCVTLVTLLLDLGLASALVQRPRLRPGAAEALATVNLALGCVMAAATWVLAPAVGSFFGQPELPSLLRVLAVAVLVKSLSVAPRALLSRRLAFGPLAVADVAGAVAGGVVGLAALVLGAGHLAFAAQVLATELVVTAGLVVAARGPGLSRSVRPAAELVPFGARVFATNGLAYVSSNVDTVLVGRFLGAQSLGYYAIAYRVLVLPVVLLGLTVHRVLFPWFSRTAGDRAATGRVLLVATQLVASAALPVMALVAVAAADLVAVVLGPSWHPAAVLVTVLAVAGARESVLFVTPALMRGVGRADLNLRFQVLSTVTQTLGVVAGLPFGVVGVAVGYAAAGVALTPVLLVIQQRLTGVRLRDQLAAVAPAAHVSAWGCAAYVLAAAAVDVPVGRLAVGGLAFVAVVAVLAATVHPTSSRRVVAWLTARRVAP
ncbi:oligosaccharide flippase family protein [Thalassiella azotivora]